MCILIKRLSLFKWNSFSLSNLATHSFTRSNFTLHIYSLTFSHLFFFSLSLSLSISIFLTHTRTLSLFLSLPLPYSLPVVMLSSLSTNHLISTSNTHKVDPNIIRCMLYIYIYLKFVIVHMFGVCSKWVTWTYRVYGLVEAHIFLICSIIVLEDFLFHIVFFLPSTLSTLL